MREQGKDAIEIQAGGDKKAIPSGKIRMLLAAVFIHIPESDNRFLTKHVNLETRDGAQFKVCQTRPSEQKINKTKSKRNNS